MKKSGIILLLLLFTLACVKKRNLSENIAIVHLPANPDGLHITNDISVYRAWIFDYTQQTLVKFDVKTQQLVPVIASNLPQANEDGTAYTYDIRKDVKWDDGSPLTVDDVIFSAKILICPATNNPQVKANYQSVIKNVEKDPSNPYRLQLYAQSKHRGNPEIFAEVYLMQKKYWDPLGITDSITFEDCYSPSFSLTPREQRWFDDFNREENRKKTEKLCGLGPYKITGWMDDSHIILERKKNWWGDKEVRLQFQNNPEKIIFRIIKDETAVYYALRNENIDATNRIGLVKLMQLQKHDYFNEQYESKFNDFLGYNYIGMNLKPDGINHPPLFTDKKIRRAMALLVPIDDIITVFYKGKALRQCSFIVPLKKDYNKTLQPIPHNPEQAKKLLEEAGWKDTDGDNIRDKVINGKKIPFSFRFMYFSEAYPSKEIALMIKEEMYRAGIEVNLFGADFGLFYEKAFSHDFDMMMASWQASSAYDDPTQLWHSSQWANFGANFCGFGDAESDSLISSMNTELNDSLYKLKADRMQEKIYNEQPYIFMFSPKTRVAIHKRFKAGIYVEKPQMAVNEFLLIPAHSGKNNLPAQ